MYEETVKRYREFIESTVEGINSGLSADERMVLRDYTNDELQSWIKHSLSEREQKCLFLRFNSVKKITFREIGNLFGVTSSRAREIIMSSANKFLRPEAGFRIK